MGIKATLVWFSNRRARWRKQAGANQLAAFNHLIPGGFPPAGMPGLAPYQLSEGPYPGAGIPQVPDPGTTVHRPQPLPPSSMHQGGGLSAGDGGTAYALSTNRAGFYSDGFMSASGPGNHMTGMPNGISPQMMGILGNPSAMPPQHQADFSLSPLPSGLSEGQPPGLTANCGQRHEGLKATDGLSAGQPYCPATYAAAGYGLEPMPAYQYTQYGQTAADYLAKNVGLNGQRRLKLGEHSAVLGLLQVAETGQAY